MRRHFQNAARFGTLIGLVLATLSSLYFLLLSFADGSPQRMTLVSAHGDAEFVERTLKEMDREHGHYEQYGLEGLDLVHRTGYRFQPAVEWRIPCAVVLVPVLLVLGCVVVSVGVIGVCWGMDGWPRG